MVVKAKFLSTAILPKVSFNGGSNNFNVAFNRSAPVDLKATFTSDNTLCKVGFKSSPVFNVSFSEAVYVAHTGGELYEGEYEVTPKVKAQRLHTANKLMEGDLIVKEIPKYSVTNLAGGETISIASEV